MKLTEIKTNLLQIFNKIYKYRILICILLFSLLVFLEIHGSSIELYNRFIQPGANISVFSKPILGKSQHVRTDEWALHTPMALSQKYENYKIDNSIWRATPTNMATTYNQPIKAFFSVVKPFYWGYLILNEAKGLSWFWCGRMIFLFLATFEFFMILTRRNKLLSLTGSVLTVFSPGIQWWFAVNDLVEQIFWGELGVISTYYFIKTDKYKIKLLLSILLALCISGFVLCFYPAWQVPFGYIFAAIGLYYIISNFKTVSNKKINIIFPVISITVAVLIILSLIIPSMEAINITRDTIYPGQRHDLGGGYTNTLFYYLLPANLFSFMNICELSHFIGLFPLPFLISIYYLVKTKFEDKLILTLLCIQFFLVVYIILGFPDFIAKITCMILSSGRAVMATSFIDLILLMRLLSTKKVVQINSKWLISVLYILIIGTRLYILKQLQIKELPQDTNIFMINLYISLILVFLFFLSYFIIKAIENNTKTKYILTSGAIIAFLICFSLINPVMKGLNTLYEIPAAKIIQQIQKENPGRWIVADFYPICNFPAIFGAPTINSTNIYPNLKLWETIDSEKKYKQAYNRYAHIPLYLTMDSVSSFYTNVNDAFILYLSYNDLPKLGVNYIMSTKLNNEYIKFPNGIEIIKIYDYINTCIFYVKYSGKAKEEYIKYSQTFWKT